ncbi:PREDICTED: DNA repair protein REV1 isoform X2 [Nicrophorus vespilloides]|uniref:DNA repair protein REV1 n=1 Tax=Nicrophorus vespilloides TaxID=110193 RepID=A0ABM1MSV8_NICVS|nr:PREDICTED: DNA repair protein REV1 isoform X2 [Nicrophorus vespilloides]
MRGGRRKRNDDDDENGFAQWGGYMEAKKAKLMEQYREQTVKSAEKVSDVLKGIAIFVNGYTKPSSEELKILMAEHGGVFHTYQVASTTHIIASMLPNVKISKLGNVPIVKPGWIVDSITLGRVLDYSNYLLYSNQSRTQPKLKHYMKSADVQSKNITKSRPISPDLFESNEFDEEVEFKLSESTEDEMKISKIIDSKRVLENNGINALTKTAYEGKISIDESKSKSVLENNSINASTKTASDPSFLAEFYNNSRLHLIATLGAEFKQLVNDMREKNTGKYPGLEAITKREVNNKSVGSIVMHIDMDCFFVSVGLRSRPELRGLPVAVTHSKGGPSRSNVDRRREIEMYVERLPEGADCRLEAIDNNSSLSEIASCSYEARKCGVKNGMFMGAALKLCPNLKAIPYDFEGYKQVSSILYKTISEYTLDIEAVSCDEMYVDIGNILQKTSFTVQEWAGHIRSVIKARTGCPCSTGFGANRLQARLATKRAKPDGQYYLKPELVEDYMSEMPLSELPGVGRATLIKLKNLGFETCKDIQESSLTVLQKEFGSKSGESIWDQSHGVDKKALCYEHERKSVSAEVNYGIRFKNEEEALTFLQRLSVEVKNRLLETGMKARGVTLKLMVRAENAPTETAKYLGHGVCDSLTRSVMLPTATEDSQVIYREIKGIYEKLKQPYQDLRGVGIQLTRLEKAVVMNSFMKSFLSKPSTKVETKKDVSFQQKSIIKEKTFKEDTTINEENKENTIEVKPPMRASGRGRPRGSKNGTKLVRKSSNELSNYFKSTQKDRPKVKQSKCDIDLNVLNELPEDIRKEIIKEYNLDKGKKLCKSTNWKRKR